MSGAWHTARYLAGTDGAHSMVRKAAGIGFRGGVPGQAGWAGGVQLAGPVAPARHHWHQEPGHANVVPPGSSAARVDCTHAGESQLAAGQARRQKAPFSLAGLSTTLTGISSVGFDAHSLSWPARTTNTGEAGRRHPGLELAATHRTPGLTCNAQPHGHPGRELRDHRPGKRSSCPPPPTPAGPRACSR